MTFGSCGPPLNYTCMCPSEALKIVGKILFKRAKGLNRKQHQVVCPSGPLFQSYVSLSHTLYCLFFFFSYYSVFTFLLVFYFKLIGVFQVKSQTSQRLRCIYQDLPNVSFETVNSGIVCAVKPTCNNKNKGESWVSVVFREMLRFIKKNWGIL